MKNNIPEGVGEIYFEGDSSPEATKRRQRRAGRTAATFALESQLKQVGGRMGENTRNEINGDQAVDDLQDFLNEEGRK